MPSYSTAMVQTFAIVRGVPSVVGTDPDLAAASARLPPGAYTTLRTYGGDGIVRLDEHLARLEQSAALQGHPTRLERAQVRAALAAILRTTRHPESRLRLTVAPPELFVGIEPFEPLSQEMYDAGVWCVTVPLHRETPQAKDTRFIAAARDAYRRLPAGAHEGLIVDEDGVILEGLSSNFFALHRGRLRTEAGRALAGVTRSLVLELVAGRVTVELVPLRLEEVSEAAECFLTSVSREVLPVVRVDAAVVGEGRPGAFTRDLRSRFRARTTVEADHVLAR
jgi:branched-chain amino acid aminotransferase